MRRLLAALLLLLLVPGLSVAATYYVNSSTGTNTATCTARDNEPTLPFDTISGSTGAARCAVAGDIIQLEGGSTAATAIVYAEALDSATTTLASGTAGNVITIKVTPGEYAIIRPGAVCKVLAFGGPDFWTIDGAGTETPPARNHLILDGRNMTCGNFSTAGVGITSASTNITLKNLTVKDVSNSGSTVCSMGVSGTGSLVTLSNILIDGTHRNFGDFDGEHGVYGGQFGGDTWIIEDSEVMNVGMWGMQFNDSNAGAQTGTGHILRRNKIHNNGRKNDGANCSGGQSGGGITITNRQTFVKVYSNFIYNNGSGNGLQAYGVSQTGIELYNNSIYGNTGHGIALGLFNPSTNAQVKNNILKNNSGGGMRIYAPAGSGIVVNTNDLHGNSGTGNTVVVDSGVTATVQNTQTVDPLFVNAGSGDLHLQASSPLLGDGLDLTSVGVTTDIDNTTISAPLDIGADQRAATQPPLVLVFTAPPVATQVSTASATIIAEIRDVGGVLQTGHASNCVLTLSSGTGSISAGTTTVAPSGGRCTWTGLVFNTVGTKQVQVTSTGVTTLVSSNFEITDAPVAAVLPVPLLMLRQR